MKTSTPSKDLETAKSPTSATRFRFGIISLFGFALLLPVLVTLNIFHYDLRSYSLLVRFLDPGASNLVVRWETHPVEAQDLSLPLLRGAVRARLYMPIGRTHPPGLVLVHGIHHLGIDEPRLMNFARAAAGNGFAVLTPEVTALADYRVDADSIATIGESPAWLEQRLGTGPVTLVGVSFAGGLALLAASDPQYAPHIRDLLLMGAYDNLARVLRFLATSEAEFPDGRREVYKAQDYGAAVFVYSNLDHFFSAGDLAVAHEALRDWLWERPQDAQPLLAQLSPDGRATMELLLSRRVEALRPKLLDAIEEDQPQLTALSPQGKLSGLRVPVYLLHGATDDIIPSTETLWLEKEIPSVDLGAALITPVFSHVDPDKLASWRDELHLVEFLARVLRAADSSAGRYQ